MNRYDDTATDTCNRIPNNITELRTDYFTDIISMDKL